ncbi:U3 small nucleolar RNA-associated protein 18 homolog [Scyliorhinus torazame]|uniref:U3 small nucleolar RNA-associated protein 18 homolog n=1 Tax=Scyliorhinus torazame TaxID=75743 RepID=UPI003B59FF2F
MAARKRRRRLEPRDPEPEAVERRLEELLFGGEEALLERLQPGKERDVGKTLLDDDSSDSEVENEAKSSFPPPKKAAWVDEEDEVDEHVDMTHRFRKNFQKSCKEKTLSMGQLQQRLKEQFQTAMGGTPAWAQNTEKKKRKDKKDLDDESDEDEDLLRKTGNFVSRSDALPKGLLEVRMFCETLYSKCQLSSRCHSFVSLCVTERGVKLHVFGLGID